VKEKLWLVLRRSALLRRLYALRPFTLPMRAAAFLLVPSSSRKRVSVQKGPAKGLLLEVDPRWQHTAWDGSYEPEAMEAYVKCVKPGMLVLDIGGGFGFYALLAARAGANVIAFEPDPGNARSLADHITINHLEKRVRIVHQAVYSHTGHVTMAASEAASAHRNSSVRANGDSTTFGFEVACTTLDDYLGSDMEPGMVKMDVEGAESHVLRGADRTIRAFRPILLCEIHDGENATFAQDWLRERDYHCLWLEDATDFPKHLLATPREQSFSPADKSD
jgi:FkbM family methyltransferase